MELKARSEHSSTRPDIRRAEFTEASAIAALIESCYRGESAAQGWTSEANLVSGDRTSREEIESIIASPRSLLLPRLPPRLLAPTVPTPWSNSPPMAAPS